MAVNNIVLFSMEINRLAGKADRLLAINGPEITSTIKDIESSAEMLENLLKDIRSGKGLAGTMLQNEQLATNVQTIADNIAITTSNLDQVGLCGVLCARKPAHTNVPTTAHNPRNLKH